MAINPLVRFAPLHILIVDDDSFLVALSADHYESLCFTVDVAVDGKQALEMIEAHRPSLILCDRKMPEMSGSALLSIIRAGNSDWQAIVFIFVTGLADYRDRHAMIDLKSDGYICKPIDFDKADQEIADILAAKRGA